MGNSCEADSLQIDQVARDKLIGWGLGLGIIKENETRKEESNLLRY